FITNKYLIFSPPKYIWILIDIGLNNNTIITPFIVLGNFLLFLVAAIGKMRGELLINEYPSIFNIPRKETRLMWLFTRYAEFIYNTWTYLEILAIISRIAEIELIPVMDIEISHVNI
ncbi:hypothetical protein BGZ57DRAFT_745053, partial [Hyaloscypha finlandica]